jgi:hypothetical protein
LMDCEWLVIRVWEHEDAQSAADAVEVEVRKRRSALRGRR